MEPDASNIGYLDPFGKTRWGLLQDLRHAGARGSDT